MGWITHLNDHRVDVSSESRFRAFSESVVAGGGEIVAKLTIPVKENTGISLGRLYMRQLLQQSSDIELVYFSNDAVAAGAMMYCLAEGMQIPKDIALASFSGLEIAGAMPIPITTVSSPRFEMGRVGVKWILKRLAGEQVPPIANAQFELIPGESS